ncbi:MAG TPA: cytochrome P450 [Thermoleophilaceae bacterium]|nr:cytochrome P450 [Thermoleophilaceae bacterium]
MNGAPPGPRLPRFVQTAFFLFGPRRFIARMHRRYGPLVQLGTAFDPNFVMVFDPALVKEVFRAPPDRLRAGEANAVLGPALGMRSVLLLDGDEHLRQRRLMLPSFHGQRMRAYEEVMREAADRAIDSWPLDQEFALLPWMQQLTLDVILRAVFGVEAGPRQDELKLRLRQMIEPVANRFGLLMMVLMPKLGNNRAVRQFEERRRLVDELIYDEIARRRDAPDLEEREDVFSMLLLARDENGAPMTDEELRDQLVTLLVAGHETTATGLAWAFDRILRTPRVRTELERAVEDGEDQYIDAVAKEALRVRPVIPGVGRVVRGGPFELGGYTLREGTEINPSIAVIHARGDMFPGPRDFRPERFLEEGPPDTYTWIPFGGGTRRCLGASFALFEMRVVIRRVIERTRLEPVGDTGEQVERRGITMVPKTGTRVVMRERRPAGAQRETRNLAESELPVRVPSTGTATSR